MRSPARSQKPTRMVDSGLQCQGEACNCEVDTPDTSDTANASAVLRTRNSVTNDESPVQPMLRRSSRACMFVLVQSVSQYMSVSE